MHFRAGGGRHNRFLARSGAPHLLQTALVILEGSVRSTRRFRDWDACALRF
ncbi:MAG: hypothetical protein RL742_976 [Bacteroidota bacterium]